MLETDPRIDASALTDFARRFLTAVGCTAPVASEAGIAVAARQLGVDKLLWTMGDPA